MSTLKKLGYPENTKLLIIHADDAGLSHAENQATIQALQEGSVNSTSIMVPCPWFGEMADFAAKHEQYDYGIHLTLTCEWKHYKWGPILSKTEVPGLLDENGYLHNNRENFKNNTSSEEIKKELQAQIERALQSGLKPTHLDSHMYTLGLKPEFIKIYKELGAAYKLPILLSKQLIEFLGLDPNLYISNDDFCVDNVFLGNYADFEKGQLEAYYERVLDNLPTGLNIVLIHTAFDVPEMQGIAIDHPNFGAEWRQIDYDFFTSQKCQSKIENNGIKLITWREIRDILYPEG
ncbi:polysaccharide deacetylase family protein [Fulvivirgaceae bacterium BMA10]|uniref:Polysaccharide deacetylase family protein n=1 Tax=Splendidivirga corallicola TaxID=3051826 RepID=A0ABT8KJP5_9BACT|nr:polysaccharide deacetylase family protein [Fulvivirgaceae bacterium BMA10]